MHSFLGPRVLQSLSLLAASSIALAGAAAWTPIDNPAQKARVIATGSAGVLLMDSVPASRSVDGGVRWAAGLASMSFYSIIPSPSDSRLFYGLGGDYGEGKNLWRSIDGGATWHELKTFGMAPGFLSFAPGPASSGVLFGVGQDALWVSRDGGFTWGGLAGAFDPRSVGCGGAAARRVNLVAVNPSDASIVLAATECGIASSGNSGLSWRLALDLPAMISSLKFARDGSGKAYATAGNTAFRSDDNGTSWNALHLPSEVGARRVVALFPDTFEAGVVWATTDQNFYRSTDFGARWQPALAPLPFASGIETPYTLEIGGPGKLFASSAPFESYEWSVAGKWKQLMAPGAAAASAIALAGSPEGDLFVSAKTSRHDLAFPISYLSRRRAGGGWEDVARDQASSLAYDAATSSVLSASISAERFTGGILTTLSRQSANGESARLGIVLKACAMLGVDPAKGTRALLGCDGDGVYTVGLGSPTNDILPVSLTQAIPNPENVIGGAWIADGSTFLLTTERLLRDFGRETVAMHPVPGATAFAVDPSDSRKMYIAGSAGVSRSTDGGQSWRSFSLGLPAGLAIRALAVTPEGLFAATGTGIWSCAGLACEGSPRPAVSVMHELFNAGTKHYFMTENLAEYSALLAGNDGWQATGESFQVLKEFVAGSVWLRRYYGTPGYGPNSHFFATDPGADIAPINRDRGWIEERSDDVYVFAAQVAESSDARCAEGTKAVLRLYNNRASAGDSNHRYTTSPAIYAQMIGQGWAGEGVRFCAP
jgi:photosystem II stability/assembly factor-like uncharacterized protein